MPRIVLENVSKRFHRGRDAVSHINLEIVHGEILAILGPSGSGKTTLLRLVAGLESASSGRLRIDGRDVTKQPPRDRDVAMVFQNQAPYPHLNVHDNLAFSARARGVLASEVEDRVRRAAEALGLADVLRRLPDALSGGERQRVALGRAIVRRPSILLLDEPFSNLDTPLRRELRTLVLQFHRELDVTTVFVTHDQQEAVGMGDRVAVIDRGEVLQVGAPRLLVETPANRFIAGFLGDPPMGLLNVSVVQDHQRRWIEFPGEPVQTVPMDGFSPIPEGDHTMGLRPEHVGIACEMRPEMLRMPICAIEHDGLDRYARLGATDGFWVRLPRDSSFLVGAVVPVRLDLGAASWFDRATGIRIG